MFTNKSKTINAGYCYSYENSPNLVEFSFFVRSGTVIHQFFRTPYINIISHESHSLIEVFRNKEETVWQALLFKIL